MVPLSKTSISTELDQFNNVVSSTDVSATASDCSLSSLSLAYGALPDASEKRATSDRVLVFTVVGIKNYSWATQFSGVFTVTVTLADGTQQTFNFQQTATNSSRNLTFDNSVSGTLDRPAYTGEESSSVATESSSSAAASSSAALSSSAASSSISSPTASATVPELSGLDIVTEVTLADVNTDSTTVPFVDDWFKLTVSFYVEKKTWSDSQFQIYVPEQFTDVLDSFVLQDNGNLAVTVAYDADSHIITGTFTDYITYHSDVHGSFTITLRLTDAAKQQITAPTTQDYTFYTVGDKAWSNTLDFTGAPTDKPSLHTSIAEDGSPVFQILTPESIGEWTDVALVAANDGSYWSFDCESSKTSISTELDQFNNVVSSTDVSATASDCSLASLSVSYGALPDASEKRATSNRVLIFTVVGIKNYSWDNQFLEI
ncbi:unnamed protein product [[Candida] boidinii]|nr:unnamed protein product [[Candida] boidinii]